MAESIDEQSGLTPKETAVLAALVQAWESYLELPSSGMDDQTDFRQAIHNCQRILMNRIVARDYPQTWR